MHHKRKRPKHRRAGCLFCKPWKSRATSKGVGREKASVRRRTQKEADDVVGS